jgi:N-methylhydantoinase A
MSVQVAALAVKNTIDETMGKEVAKVMKELGPGTDPLLVVYGGAGPAHCCRLSQVAGIKRILITPFSAVFSAFSSSNMDVGHIYYRRAGIPLDEKTDMQALRRLFDEMRKEAQRDMRGEGFPSEGGLELLEFFVQNTGTGREMKFTAPSDAMDEAKKISDLLSQARHALKGDKGLMLTTLGLISQAPVPHYQIRKMPEAAYPLEKAKKGSRSVLLDERERAKDIPVYDWSRLQNGHKIQGPAVIESEHTTALVRSDWKLAMDHYGHALLEEVKP